MEGYLWLCLLFISVLRCNSIVATSKLLEKYLSSECTADTSALFKKCNVQNAELDNFLIEECKQVKYFFQLQKAQENVNSNVRITVKRTKQFQVEVLPSHLSYSNVFEEYIVTNR